MSQTADALRCVSPHELDALMAEHADVRVLDVRTAGEFESAHIPGAYNIPLPDVRDVLEELRGVSSRVVVVCQSGSRAGSACSTLAEAGIDGVELLDGGMAAWVRTGGAVRRGPHRWDLERQVRLVAGSLVLGSLVAGLARPAARAVAAGVGAGLVFAAVSNTCTMGMLLAKLPFNRPRHAPADAVTTARHLLAGTTPTATAPATDAGACPAA